MRFLIHIKYEKKQPSTSFSIKLMTSWIGNQWKSYWSNTFNQKKTKRPESLPSHDFIENAVDFRVVQTLGCSDGRIHER